MLPHEFRNLWLLRVEGPQTAGEIASARSIDTGDFVTGVAVANQLRRHLGDGGFVEGDRDRIYRLTDASREYVDA